MIVEGLRLIDLGGLTSSDLTEETKFVIFYLITNNNN